jgi:hypothetical protein
MEEPSCATIERMDDNSEKGIICITIWL